MEKYHEMGSLAPRDIVSRAIDFELKKRDERFVYLDTSPVEKNKLQTHFPYIDKKCKRRVLILQKTLFLLLLQHTILWRCFSDYKWGN